MTKQELDGFFNLCFVVLKVRQAIKTGRGIHDFNFV
jgi:hypothetical protein